MSTMKQVRITAEAREALECYNLREVGCGVQFPEPNSDGSFTIELSDDVLEHLNAHTFPGESISDVLVQLCEAKRSN